MTIGSIALLATAGVGGYLLFTTKDATTTSSSAVSSTTQVANNSLAQPQATTPTTQTTDTTSATTTSTSTSGYKDGTYTASASYSVPHGAQNTISATVTISGGTIASVTANDNYNDGESAMYVDSFESALTSSAKGQTIASYSPSRIGAASLTTAAFNNVLDTIRSQAQA